MVQHCQPQGSVQHKNDRASCSLCHSVNFPFRTKHNPLAHSAMTLFFCPAVTLVAGDSVATVVSLCGSGKTIYEFNDLASSLALSSAPPLKVVSFLLLTKIWLRQR